MVDLVTVFSVSPMISVLSALVGSGRSDHLSAGFATTIRVSYHCQKVILTKVSITDTLTITQSLLGRALHDINLQLLVVSGRRASYEVREHLRPWRILQALQFKASRWRLT